MKAEDAKKAVLALLRQNEDLTTANAGLRKVVERHSADTAGLRELSQVMKARAETAEGKIAALTMQIAALTAHNHRLIDQINRK